MPRMIKQNRWMVPMTVQFVLRGLASQEGCDGEEWDAMKDAANYIDELEDLLLASRVLVAMDTLPENVPDEGQRKVAEDLLDQIDSLIPEEDEHD